MCVCVCVCVCVCMHIHRLLVCMCTYTHTYTDYSVHIHRDPEEMVKLDDDEEEEGNAAAPAQSKAVVGDSHTPEEAASALERAHISLTVQVDVGDKGATKKASGEESIVSGVCRWHVHPTPSRNPLLTPLLRPGLV